MANRSQDALPTATQILNCTDGLFQCPNNRHFLCPWTISKLTAFLRTAACLQGMRAPLNGCCLKQPASDLHTVSAWGEMFMCRKFIQRPILPMRCYGMVSLEFNLSQTEWLWALGNELSEDTGPKHKTRHQVKRISERYRLNYGSVLVEHYSMRANTNEKWSFNFIV